MCGGPEASGKTQRAGPAQRADPVSCLSVTLRRGRLTCLGMLGSAALAAAVVLGGCSAAAAPAKTGAGSGPALTLAQAQAAYDSYVTASTAAAKQGDATHGLAMVGDAQWALLHAQYTALATKGVPVTQYSYGTPVFYVPALPTYPLWFVVQVPISTEAGGHLGPAVSTLLAFQRYIPSRPWTLDGSAVLDQPLPALAHDSAGYATPVGTTGLSTTGPSLLLPTSLVGPTQAAVVDEGPTAPAAAAVGSGPHTTALFAAQSAQGNAASARGLNYLWLLQTASFAQYELRTADGGALVLYAMYLNTTTEHPGNLPGAPIPVPADFAPLITTGAAIGHRGVDANWTYEFVAVDPPATVHGAKVEVIGGSGGPTYGHAY
jgi:hypothetical protein